MASVLIVDNDADTRMLLAERLRHHQLSILLAGNFVEACAVTDRHDVAIVVLQLNQAGANGFEILRKLRVRYPTVRIAVTTDWMEPAIERLAQRLGANVVFRTPFTTDQVTAVDQLLAAPLASPAGSPDS